MLQSVNLRRNIDTAYRFLPLLRKCCKTFASALQEVDDLPKRSQDVERCRQPKKYRKHFIENLFIGLYEPEILEYPQIRTQEEVDLLKEHGERADRLLLHGLDCKEIEATGKITKEMFARLQENDLVGMKIKLKDDGLGYHESESYYVQESLHHNSSLCKIITDNESSGYQIVQTFGSEAQKEEYSMKFLKGECISCLAHLEHETWVMQDSSQITTVAVQEGDGSFVISGRKTLVCNPNSSDIVLVSAKVSGAKDNSYTLFMVDKNSKGLSVLEPLDKFSLKGTEICDIVFDKVVVSPDKIIGNVNEGDKIVDKLISQGKLSNGGYCIGVMRKLVNEAINHCISNNHFNRPLYSYKYVQGKIGEIMQALYAAESMTYLMTGRVDEDPELDVKLESLIVKIFNSEALNFILYNYMHLVGKDKCNDEFLKSIIQDAPFFTAFDDPNTFLKMILVTTGVKYTLNQMTHKTVKNYRPIRKMKLKYINWIDEIKMKKSLEGYLHLTLTMESSLLEYCVDLLNFLTEFVILRHGSGILSKPYYLNHLAELTIIIYKLTAVLGRSSRAYCIGLRHAEHDIRIARNIAQNSYQRALTIKHYVATIVNEPTYKNVANYVSATGKFCNQHPAEPVTNKSKLT